MKSRQVSAAIAASVQAETIRRRSAFAKAGCVAVVLLAGLVAACASPTQGGAGTPLRDAAITNDARYAWGELQMAINPRNPDNIAYATVGVTLCEGSTTGDCEPLASTFYPPVPGLPAGAMGRRARGFYENPDFTAIFVYYSMDGGRTWERSRLPAYPRGLPRLTSQGDPGLTAGADGTFYATWDANDWGTPERTLQAAGVAVSMSRDGGRTWSEPVLTGLPVDGPKVVADLTTGDIYAAASTFRGPRSTGNPNLPLDPTNDRWVVRSRDGVTWSETQGMGGFGSYMTAAHGVFATAFTTSSTPSPFAPPNNQLCGNAPAPCSIFETTTDAGRTWSRHILPIQPGAGAAAGGFSGQPMVAADPTRRGRFTVSVPMGPAFHVFTTNDSGATWTAPTVVTPDASRQPFHSAMAYSREGVLGVIWRSRQPGPQGGFGQPQQPRSYNVWAMISRVHGATFSQPLAVSSADSPGGNGSGDDYSHVAVGSDYLYAGWADWRPGTRSGYFSAVPLSDFRF